MPVIIPVLRLALNPIKWISRGHISTKQCDEFFMALISGRMKNPIEVGACRVISNCALLTLLIYFPFIYMMPCVITPKFAACCMLKYGCTMYNWLPMVTVFIEYRACTFFHIIFMTVFVSYI